MRNVRTVLVALVLVGALVGVGATTPTQRTLVVDDAATGERLLFVPVTENTTVALEYTHSVERNRVLDAYAVRGDRLVMTRMEFESYGAGLPADADVSIEDGRFVFDPDGTYAELYVKPGRIAGHELHVGDRSYDLVSLSDGRSVRLSLDRRSALDLALASLL